MWPGDRRRYKYWVPFCDAVEAMRPHDLLIWRMRQSEVQTARTRIAERRSDDVRLMFDWCDGKLFVVRMR